MVVRVTHTRGVRERKARVRIPAFPGPWERKSDQAARLPCPIAQRCAVLTAATISTPRSGVPERQAARCCATAIVPEKEGRSRVWVTAVQRRVSAARTSPSLPEIWFIARPESRRGRLSVAATMMLVPNETCGKTGHQHLHSFSSRIAV